MFAFLLLLFSLVVIFCFTSVSEGFNPVNQVPSHQVNIPTNKIPPPVPSPPATTKDFNVEPSSLPGQLPVASYEQIAAMSPLPYQDTTLIKANRQQLVSLLELLKGFLSFEAQEIAERSDPTIQLPLNTARSDFDILQSQVQVLNRNPGLQSNITLTQLNEIASNLAYLQRQVRLIGTAGALQGPTYEFTKSIEGFENTQTGSTTDSTSGGQSDNSDPELATKEDLERFVARLKAEIIRLMANATTDPEYRARVGALTQLKNDVESIIEQVNSGILMPSEIPIMKQEIDRAFPKLSNISEPIPDIFKRLGIENSFLANLFPKSISNDPSSMREINKLVDKYADTVVNGISASFNVKYTSPRDAERNRKKNSTIDKTGFPSLNDLMNVSNNKFIPADNDMAVTDRLAARPMDCGRGPAQFDWKERAKQIEDQIKKRGLKGSDFGIMPDNSKVSQDFSWKGYCKMICTRLQATMDPGLPETCGCPPMDWKGWRIAK